MVSATAGLLGADVTMIHCSNLDEDDLNAVSSRGVSVSLTPSSEMASGSGPPPIQKLLDRNIRPGLGIDNEQIAPGDMFAQMRTAISLQHASYFDLKLAGKAGLPNLLTTRDVIRYGTVDGARVAGLGAMTGSLEPGKQADVVILRTDRPNIAPINDPIGAVVWGMDTSNVDWVFVNGRALMRNGVLEADIGAASEAAVTSQRRVAGAARALAEPTGVPR
jgi:cytosine/adenosine deaminase-related metal-dependent hydrolase